MPKVAADQPATDARGRRRVLTEDPKRRPRNAMAFELDKTADTAFRRVSGRLHSRGTSRRGVGV